VLEGIPFNLCLHRFLLFLALLVFLVVPGHADNVGDWDGVAS
jgi:hypothetical protein